MTEDHLKWGKTEWKEAEDLFRKALEAFDDPMSPASIAHKKSMVIAMSKEEMKNKGKAFRFEWDDSTPPIFQNHNTKEDAIDVTFEIMNLNNPPQEDQHTPTNLTPPTE